MCPIVKFSKQAFHQNEQFMNKQYIIMNERTENKLMFLNDLFKIQTKCLKTKNKGNFFLYPLCCFWRLTIIECLQSCFLLDYVQNQLCFIAEFCFGRLTMEMQTMEILELLKIYFYWRRAKQWQNGMEDIAFEHLPISISQVSWSGIGEGRWEKYKYCFQYCLYIRVSGGRMDIHLCANTLELIWFDIYIIYTRGYWKVLSLTRRPVGWSFWIHRLHLYRGVRHIRV